jgi:allantoin racemase
VRPNITYIIPVTTSEGARGPAMLRQRCEALAAWAGERAGINVVGLEQGPLTIESFADEALAAAPSLARVREASQNGADAIIMGCYGDTVLEAARELSPIPVVGPGQASLHYAALLGERFSILTVVESVVPMLRRMVRLYGLEPRLASILPVGVAVAELASARDETVRRLFRQGRRAIRRHGADTLVVGCMSLAFEPRLTEFLQSELDVPVLNPARIALDVAISLCNQNLSHSRRPRRPGFAGA